MATISQLENSAYSAQPIELFWFVSADKEYSYTSSAFAQTITLPEAGERTFGPLAGLFRNDLPIVTNGNAQEQIEVEVPFDTELVRDYMFANTPPAIRLSVYRKHETGTDFVTIWQGNINSIQIKGDNVTIRGSSDLSSFSGTNFPNLTMLPACQNVLYDGKCKADKSANTWTTIVTGQDNLIVHLQTKAYQWLKGGIISTAKEKRSIVFDYTKSVTIDYPFSERIVGKSVTLTRGCDHSFTNQTGCKGFNNQENFGGMPFMPGEDNNFFVNGV